MLLVPELRTEWILLEQMHVVEALSRMVAGVFHQRIVGTLHVPEAPRAGGLHAFGLGVGDLRLRQAEDTARARPGVAADEDRTAVIPGIERQEREVRPGSGICQGAACVSVTCQPKCQMAVCGDVTGGVATLVNRIRTLVGDWSAGSPPQLAFAVLGNCLV